MTLMTDAEVATGAVLDGPGPLFLVHVAPAAGGEVVDLTGDAPGSAGALRAVTDGAVLHGWLDAHVVTGLLRHVGAAHPFRVLAAVEHAAMSIDRAAPGSAALCGLARSLVSRQPGPEGLATTLSQYCQRFSVSGQTPDGVPAALRTDVVAALAGPEGDNPAALAALFLRPRQLRAGDTLPLRPGVPVALVTGQVEVAVRTGATVVTGASPDGAAVDVPAFTKALAVEPATQWSRSA